MSGSGKSTRAGRTRRGAEWRRRSAWAAPLAVAVALGSAGVLVTGTVAGASTGPSWSVVTGPLVPSNANADPLGSVEVTACPAPGNCVGAGDYKDVLGHLQATLLRLSDGTWTATEAPLPTNAGTLGLGPFMEAATCVTVGTCEVVGSYQDSDNLETALFETLSGTTWTPTEAPLPANTGTDTDGNADSDVLAVSCPAAGACVAVGRYDDTEGYETPLIEIQSGSSWVASEAPEPSNAGTDADTFQASYLNSLVCPSPGRCVAAGAFRDTSGQNFGLIDTLSNGTWTTTAAPLPSNAGSGSLENSYLTDVSCPANGSCVASGIYADGSGYDYSMLETQSGTGWSSSEAPLPANAGNDADAVNTSLNGVDCPAVGSCAAVGDYKDTNGFYYGLIDILSGGVWRASEAPEPSNSGTEADLDQGADLSGVSCSWPGQCVASGNYRDTMDHSHGMIMDLLGSTSSVLETLYPTALGSAPSVYTNTPSCTAAMCVVSGSYVDTSGHQQALLDEFEGTGGYDLAASDGGIFSFHAPFFGSMGGQPLNKPIVGITIDPATDGYFEVASDGGMFAFNAPYQGSMGGQPLNAPIVGMAFDTRTGGYYEVASDGGIFAFGAPFYGSMGGKPLNAPIVGIAFDSVTGGYYEVASDGGIFAFGAPFFGSMGGKPLNMPIVGIAFDSITGGYYEVASDGGLFSFGAPFLGSTGNITLNKPVVGMAFDPLTGGYYEVATDGGIFAYGTPFYGSTGNITLVKPVVGIAVS
jgi:hypothetical protein